LNDRPYDLVLYGATGFVGKQTVAYVAKHRDAAALRFAIAGRNRDKLDAVRVEVGGMALQADILVADCRDQPALDAMAARTRVLLNTAGPFSLHGDAVVDACVRNRTHYVDITGETAWVRGLIDRHDARCAAEGTRIITCCGFDSVPSDLGAWLAVRDAQQTFGMPCRSVRSYFQIYGGFNGGTIASALHSQESGQAGAMGNPFLLDDRDHPVDEIERNRDVFQVSFDPEVGTWIGPFFMAPVNTRVVRRSAALFESYGEPYGPAFQYQEYLKYDPPWARAKAIATTAALKGFAAALKHAAGRRLLLPFLPAPGQGPSERMMANGWMRCEAIGKTDDGRRVGVFIRDVGDPGNRITTKCVCEAALGLVRNADSLPGGRARGGVLTAATGLGDVLVERLRRAGMVIEAESRLSDFDAPIGDHE
jgi:short subunit dehydrogenase-like uncharacterized protein